MTRFHKRPVYKCDKLSMEVLEAYQSAMEAELANGLRVTSVAFHAKRKNVSSGPYVWRYADEYDPNESFEDRKNRPIACYDTMTKKAAVFLNLPEAARLTGLHHTTIVKAMSEGRLVKCRLLFKYAR